MEDEERRRFVQSLREALIRIEKLEAFLDSVAEDGCLCHASAGDCPACRAKTFLKENP